MLQLLLLLLNEDALLLLLVYAPLFSLCRFLYSRYPPFFPLCGFPFFRSVQRFFFGSANKEDERLAGVTRGRSFPFAESSPAEIV